MLPYYCKFNSIIQSFFLLQESLNELFIYLFILLIFRCRNTQNAKGTNVTFTTKKKWIVAAGVGFPDNRVASIFPGISCERGSDSADIFKFL